MVREAGMRRAWVWSTHPLFPIKSAMDFLYCHIKIEKDERQVRPAVKDRMWSTVNEMVILNTHSLMLLSVEMIEIN